MTTPTPVSHPLIRRSPFTRLLLLGLLFGISGCLETTTPSSLQPAASGLAASTGASAVPCEQLDGELTSLTTPENTPIFEQFNFQPQAIETTGSTVTVTTPHHIFSLCKQDGSWQVISSDTSSETEPSEFNYDQMLEEIADPTYTSIEHNGDTYQYRIRLNAAWLNEQLSSQSSLPSAADSPEEDSVIFELKTPDGEDIISTLYTLSDLQEAQLGASLGDPSIAGAIASNSSLWFAATSSQGEGNSGFATLIHYDTDTGELTLNQPEELQGQQFTTLAATGGEDNLPLTLWLGTQRSGEGLPYLPASGLVAYQPESDTLTQYTPSNSPLVGAIPRQLTVDESWLWVGTGDGICEVPWQLADTASSWTCWRFTATADLPEEGVPIYRSFLSDESTTTLQTDTAEVLWVNRPLDPQSDRPARYEVVYDPGFETTLDQGGYQVTDPVIQRITQGENLFWPGNQWHWNGHRFERGLDEVALNLVGGGPQGLTEIENQTTYTLDHHAIRGEFDLLSLSPDATEVRYYSGWVNASDLSVYPTVVPAEPAAEDDPNPLTAIAPTLEEAAGP